MTRAVRLAVPAFVFASSLAIGALSFCLVVTLTVLSIKVSTAMPLPV